MNIDKLIRDYLVTVKLRFSDGTFRFNKNHLEHFRNFCYKQGITDVADVNDGTIVDYVATMKKTCENITINKVIGCIKRMYIRMNIDFPFLLSMEKLKERKKDCDFLDYDTYKKLRKYIREMQTVTVNAVYYRCFLALLVDTGARIGEVMLIEKKNVNLERSEILLTSTKSKTDRVVYLSDKVGIPAVSEMLQVKSKSKYLLHNVEKNRPANYDDIRYILKFVKRDLGLKKLHPHMLRHSTATTLVEAGCDLESVKTILGHKNIQTTQIYLHLSKKHVKKSYQDNINSFDNQS
jgi:integrase/recombinase XerC